MAVMADDGERWMKAGLSLPEQLTLEASRRAIPRLHRHDLEARLDSALVHLAHCRAMLHQATRRVAELELREAAGPPPAAKARRPGMLWRARWG